MTTAEDRVCLCSHPESEHTLQGECAIERREGNESCGCQRFTALPEVCYLCGWRGERHDREVNWCGEHDRWVCRRCWFSGWCR